MRMWVPSLFISVAQRFLCFRIAIQSWFLAVRVRKLATLGNSINRKEAQMAALGARMLAPEKKDAEAAQTHEIKRSDDGSVCLVCVVF